MNKKQLLILFAIVGLLGAALAAKRLMPRSEVYEEEAQSLQVEFNPETIDRVVITKGADETGVELQRMNGLWRIPSLWNAKADAEKIRRWLGHLAALQGEARSEADDVLSDFGITDQEALHLTLFQGGRPAQHLLVGTKQAGWQQVFVRKANSSTVFLAESPLLSEMGIYGGLETAKPTADVWADLRMFSFSPETIERVEIKEEEFDWQELGGPLPFERDSAQVQSYLESLAGLRAQRVVDPKGATDGFDKPAWQLRLVRKEGSPVVVTIGAPTAEGSTDRYLRTEDAPDVYVVASYTLDQIKADGSRFIGSDPLNVESGTFDRFTVTVPGRERITTSLQEGRWPGLEEYLRSLKSFRVAKVNGLPERAKADLATPYRIDLAGKQEQDTRTIACEAPSADDAGGQVVCINQRNTIPFLVDRATFESVFERLERLERPAAPEPQPASAPEGEPAAESAAPEKAGD